MDPASSGPTTPWPTTGAPAAPPSTAPPMPPMCFSCGQMLTADQAKCPSCGAPVRGSKPARRMSKTRVAAVCFVGLFAILALQGYLFTTNPETIVSAFPPVSSSRFSFTGTVTFENGTAAPGVSVFDASDPANGTTTDANGTFTLARLATGFHNVTFTLENFTTQSFEAFLFGKDESAAVRLLPGTDATVQQHESYRTLVTIVKGSGFFLFGVGLLALAGAFSCYRRRRYGLALTAAIVVLIITILNFPTDVLALIALVLVARGKSEFS